MSRASWVPSVGGRVDEMHHFPSPGRFCRDSDNYVILDEFMGANDRTPTTSAKEEDKILRRPGQSGGLALPIRHSTTLRKGELTSSELFKGPECDDSGEGLGVADNGPSFSIQHSVTVWRCRSHPHAHTEYGHTALKAVGQGPHRRSDDDANQCRVLEGSWERSTRTVT